MYIYINHKISIATHVGNLLLLRGFIVIENEILPPANKQKDDLHWLFT